MKKKIILIISFLLLIFNFTFAVSLLTPSHNNTNPVPVLMVAAGDTPETVSPYTNKISIKAGDVVVFHIHGYADGGDAKNTRFKLDNVEREFKAGSTQNISAYVSADNAPTVNGAVTLSFRNDVELVYKTYTWATQLRGLEPEPTEHFHNIPNGVSGKKAMTYEGVSLGNLEKDHRSNLILYFTAVGKKKEIVPVTHPDNGGDLVNGVCGSIKYTCTTGKADDFDKTSSQFTWVCKGFNGGVDKFCTSRRVVSQTGPVNAKCSTKVNKCIRGWKKDIKDSDTEYLWICKGLRGGSDVNCSVKKKPTDAKCSEEENKCISGTFEDIEDTEFEVKWKCVGKNGGESFECTKDKMCPCKDVKKNQNNNNQQNCPKIQMPVVPRNQQVIMNNCEMEKEKITELSMRIKELEGQPQKFEEKPEDPDVIVEGCEKEGFMAFLLNPFSFLFLIIVIAILGLKLYIISNDRRE